MKKKIVSIIGVITLLVTLCSCVSIGNESSKNDPSKSTNGNIADSSNDIESSSNSITSNGGTTSSSSSSSSTTTSSSSSSTHNHDYSLKYDNEYHYFICSCGDVINKEKHTFGEWIVTKEATATSKGSKERKCSVCNYTETAEVSECMHEVINDGICSDCGKTINISYEVINENECEITKGVLEGNVSIPKSIDGYIVTSICRLAFFGCGNLTSITIPNSVTSIGYYAFEDCSSLTKVNITDLTAWCKISFSNYASNPLSFAHNLYLNNELVTELVIPDGITYIGNYTFNGCSGLTSIIIPNSVTSISDYAFEGCSGLTSISIPESVTRIGDSAFSGCSGLTCITIPNSVTNIGRLVFSGCSSLTSITISNSVLSIGEFAFSGCSSLTKVNITDLTAWCKIAFSRDSNPLYYAHNLYLNNELVTHLVIPEGVTSISDYAFEGCSGLISITIPNSVTSIGDSAFSGCSGLTSITLPFIGDKLDNPNYTHLGYIFGPWLYSSNSDVPSSLKEVIITKATSIGDSAFSGCSSLTSVTIPEGVTSIGNDAFKGCNGLTSITIPNSVTSIGYYAFEDCSSLTKVNITDLTAWCKISFSSYASNPLSYAHNLYLNNELVTELVIPDGITYIGNYTFSGCCSLTSVTIPEGVTSIGYSALYGCSGLTSISIPDSVTSIGYYAFSSSLNKIYYDGNATDWNKLSNRPYYGTVYYYSETKPTTSGNYWYYVGGEVVEWSWNFLFEINKISNDSCEIAGINGDDYSSDIEIPNMFSNFKVVRIGERAFANNSKIESVVIPTSIKSIGEGAFYNCTNLKKIYYSGTVENWCGISFEYIKIYNDDESQNDAEQVLSSIYSNPMIYSVISEAKIYFDNDFFTPIQEIIIPNEVQEIGNLQFIGFSENIVLHKNITSIGVGAFSGCSGLTNITIPEGVTSIGDGAFWGCSSLTSISIPESVTSIGYSAFEGCSSLTSIIIPESVTSIGDYAFSGCSGLNKIYYGGNATNWNNLSNRPDYGTVYYYSEIKPETSGNYWHYVDGKIEEW